MYSGGGSEDTPDNDSTIITDTGTTATTINDDQGSINTVRMMASAASLKDQDSITVITEGRGAGYGVGSSHDNPSLYDGASLEKGEGESLNLGQGKTNLT